MVELGLIAVCLWAAWSADDESELRNLVVFGGTVVLYVLALAVSIWAAVTAFS